MALVAADYIRPLRRMGGGVLPLFNVTKASATTWTRGDIIIGTSGLAVEAADGPVRGTILGVAVEDAVNGNTKALVCAVLPDVVFQGKIATGDAGGDYTSLVTNRFTSYGLSLEAATSGVWYINAADTTDLAVRVLEFIDDIGDNLASVEFVFTLTSFVEPST